MMGGSAIMVEGWHERVPAILMLWYPGMEGGRALADVLLGNVNPGGRLPFAVPRDESHLAPFDREAEHVTYDLFHGQWLLDRDDHPPRYPFGFGLSYAPARVRDVTIERKGVGIMAEATLENDSDRPTSEVVQVYAGTRSSARERPLWRLAGFARTDLEPKTSARVHVAIPLDRLAVRINGKWLIEPGDYEIAVGLHARDPNATVVMIRAEG
jgi:beta-glucosidase